MVHYYVVESKMTPFVEKETRLRFSRVETFGKRTTRTLNVTLDSLIFIVCNVIVLRYDNGHKNDPLLVTIAFGSCEAGSAKVSFEQSS
jgi:hypothetical protein